jgi:hypothetical protein
MSWLAVAFLTGSCQATRGGPLEAQASDEWERHYDLIAGGEVQVIGTAGSIDIQGGPGARVDVRAQRVVRARTEAAARDIVPRIRIREEVTPDKIVLQSERLDGVVIGVELAVHYHVVLPQWARVRVRTVDGPIMVVNVEGQVVASGANGQIVGRQLSGPVDARSVNGSVTLDLASFRENPIDIRATNGYVDLGLPRDANASLLANGSNGTISVTDLKFEPFGEQSKRRVRGRINAGGTPIEITTVNGDIRVHPRQ